MADDKKGITESSSLEKLGGSALENVIVAEATLIGTCL